MNKQMQKTKSVFKIRNKTTGLFSKGGSYASNNSKYHWSEAGKTWSSRGALMNHLAQYVKLPYGHRWGTAKELPKVDIPEDWEVVEIEMRIIEDIGVHTPARDFYINRSEHFKK